VKSPIGNLISVVVPIYGGEIFVEQCIDSLLTQSHQALEVILVNDGSPDRAGEICDKAAKLDKRVKVIHQENSGLVSARKAGVSRASGQYLGFVDGDDWVGADYFGQLHELIATNSADLAISGHIRDFLGKQELIAPVLEPGVFDQNKIVEEILPYAIFNGVYFQHGVSTYVWNKLFRRSEASEFIRTIPEDIVVGEDAALTYPYLFSCSKIVVAKQGEYFYRQRPRSILKSVPDIEVEYKRLSSLFEYLIRALSSAPPNAHVNEQLINYFFSLVLIRSGGIITDDSGERWFSPFRELTSHRKIAVCSSGSFGQLLMQSLMKFDMFELVSWIDDDEYESQSAGLPVRSLDSLTELEFDVILIASIDEKYSESMARRLEQLGVPESKISRVRPNFDELEAILSHIGFDLKTYSFKPKDLTER